MNKEIKQLLHYGIHHKLLAPCDEIYCRNQLLDILKLSEYNDVEIDESDIDSPQPILDRMLSYAIDHGIIEDTQESRDSFDTRIMNALMPRPSEVISNFQKLYLHSSKAATDYYYELSKASNYIRMDRIRKDKKWLTPTRYGDLDITINLSKPEKDPKDIARAKLLPPAVYPKCLLCKENEGYAGTLSHPARNNHRLIPLTLNHTAYALQYSPYSYYPEHSIILNQDHIPMKIDANTFQCLLDFVEQFPHYFIGSNADLPIVGGSILSHDHFQGGRFTFAMARARMMETRISNAYPSITYGRVFWPLSVIRLQSKNKEELISFADEILHKWRDYSDASLDILSHTEDTPHNTITPIARSHDGGWELDLTLRNNRTSEEHPLGIFHPHEPLHHIKKENIGLIEVMGLAVLPSRLLHELQVIEDCLIQHSSLPDSLRSHEPWFAQLSSVTKNMNREELHHHIEQEVGHIFEQVLEDAGVFKQDEKGQEGFLRFLDTVS